MSKKTATESDSLYDNLEKMSVVELLSNINREDQKVPQIIEKHIPQIAALVTAATQQMALGGRLFYLGAGTSGRLGIVDASECPPTFGVPHDKVIGLIAGGDSAIRMAVEFAEDDFEQAWKDLENYNINNKDVIVGIAASGRTPYVIGALKKARELNITTGCIVCNSGSEIAENSDFPIEIEVGPEFVTGSTRMKSGTAQKLVLNMLSTSVMIGLGHVVGNKMVDMQLSNHKLVKRGIIMLMEKLNIRESEAADLLEKHGSVRNAIQAADF
ncbi:MAG: N-acetylmuramic acid 6-phosphate etherase [Sphingobacteriales bacterium]|jgi:N-acetylmuramic acid 6-phosphate etherase